MRSEYPYQLVAFLAQEPVIGEAVYGGENGWYPQLAVKRRFNGVDISEDELMERIAAFCSTRDAFSIHAEALVQTERMPVKVIEVTPTAELMGFHTDFINYLGAAIISRFPERDGESYYPHITAEFNNEMVLDAAMFENRTFKVASIWLLKDIYDHDSVAYKSFLL